MPKVYNKKTDKDIPEDAVYVGRPSKWGNPFVMQKEEDREAVVNLYRWYLWNSKVDVSELKGKDLVCWCAPKACHADVLLELANK